MDLIQGFQEIVGPQNVLTDPNDQAGYMVDWTNRFHGRALAVVRPASTEEVSKIMALAHANDIPVVVQSGNTSLVGGGTHRKRGAFRLGRGSGADDFPS